MGILINMFEAKYMLYFWQCLTFSLGLLASVLYVEKRQKKKQLKDKHCRINKVKEHHFSGILGFLIEGEVLDCIRL
jgi:hypothetical protein